MNKLYIGTNTKMYKTIADTREYLLRLRELCADVTGQTVLFVIPSFTALETAGRCVHNTNIRLGAQNMCWQEEGQFTGEISPKMLKETGVEIVELGHSERRHIFGETNGMLCKKMCCALDYGFTALLCVGETEEEKALGITRQVIETQLLVALSQIKAEQVGRLWVAYEPVWAIGVNGKPASSDYVQGVHALMRETLTQLLGSSGAEVPLLYGGSVNPDNARAFMQMPDIDGLFIGRSAWQADAFSRIIHEMIKLEKP